MALAAERVEAATWRTEPGAEFDWRDAGPGHVHGHVGRPLVQALDRCQARSVLDLGCGNGWLSAALARCGFDVTGVDTSHSGIAIARHSHPELNFRHADAMLAPPADWLGRFDAVVAVELLDHVPRPRLVLRHTLALLRPGGVLLATVPFHGYWKNLGLALSDRVDLRLQALDEHGRLKFYSRRTLSTLFAEAGYVELGFRALGRLPPVARSMLVSGRRPAS